MKTPREQAIARAGAVFKNTEGYTPIYDALVNAYEEIERMRPVVDAAVEWWADTPNATPALLDAVIPYVKESHAQPRG